MRRRTRKTWPVPARLAAAGACGVHVPHVHAHDMARGLPLLEDLGSTHMLTALRAGGDAGRAVCGGARRAGGAPAAQAMQPRAQLPPYDRAVLLREMQLLPEWFCARHLGFEPDAGGSRLLAETFEFLIARGAGAAGGVRASRLPLAQPHDHAASAPRASSISRMRCAARSATTWSRC